jgi:hypothetical protein
MDYVGGQEGHVKRKPNVYTTEEDDRFDPRLGQEHMSQVQIEDKVKASWTGRRNKFRARNKPTFDLDGSCHC